VISQDAFNALRGRIWASASAKVHRDVPLPPATLDEQWFDTQDEVDEYNKAESERDHAAEQARADQTWEAWEYVARALGWDLPSAEEVASQPVVWCQP
jgi:hypothetical protein